MAHPTDPFVGTWTLDPSKSEFDPNHRPASATLVFEIDADGHHVMKAEGTRPDGARVVERASRFVTDGVARPLPDLPQLTVVSTRPRHDTLHSVARRPDGSIVGESTIVVSSDGRTLTATNSGVDAQLRTFRQSTCFTRVEAAELADPLG
jgi:hypothetical protein